MALALQWKTSTVCTLKLFELLVSEILALLFYDPSPILTNPPSLTLPPKLKDYLKPNFQFSINSDLVWDTAKALSGWYLPLQSKQQT